MNKKSEKEGKSGLKGFIKIAIGRYRFQVA